MPDTFRGAYYAKNYAGIFGLSLAGIQCATN